MAELQPYRGGYYLWKYIPSVPAAVIFAILFFAITGLHCYRLFKTRLWFCLPFFIGGIMEFIGYIARAASSSRTGELPPYITQQIMLLLPPALFAASIYMVLGRIIRAVHGEAYSLIRVNILTRTFVLGDVASFLTQGSGAGLMATASNMQMGQNIVVAGLIIQIVMFGLFVVTAVIFQRRYQKHGVTVLVHEATGWKASMFMLYGVSALIMIRSIFRVVEFAQGYDGYLLRSEWSAYVFDAVPMLIVMCVFFWWYPDNLKPSQDACRLMNLDGTDNDVSELR